MQDPILTDRQWKRLTELRERIRARHERERRRREASCVRIRYTEGDRRARDYFERDRRATIALEIAAKLLRIPVESLLAATSEEPFFLDFGRSWNGKQLRYFHCVELMHFATSHVRNSSTRRAQSRPATTQEA
jgi:hypothetical protein